MSALTERQEEVLRDLARLRDRPDQCSRKIEGQAWAAPLDFGGTNGSHHSATATWLAKRGLVDRWKLCHWNKDGTRRLNVFKGSAKSSCCYRITDAGLTALANIDKENATCA